MNAKPHPEDWSLEADLLMRLPRNDLHLQIKRSLAEAWRDGRLYERQEKTGKLIQKESHAK